MKTHLPLTLRRALLSALASLSVSAFGAEYAIDAGLASDPAQKTYQTLQELVLSGSLSAGDTVVLHNDDSSLVSGLSVSVNFQSGDPEVPHVADLSGLGASPLFNLGAGDFTLGMEGLVWSNAGNRVLNAEGFSRNTSLTVAGAVEFLHNTATGFGSGNGGGAIFVQGNSLGSVTLDDHSTFRDNHVSRGTSGESRGGAILVWSNSAQITVGDGASFINNYVEGSTGRGGAISARGGDTVIKIGDDATFTGNYVSASSGNGGAIEASSNATTITLGNNARFTGNHILTSADSASGVGGAIGTMIAGYSCSITLGDNALFTGNFIKADGKGSGNGGAIGGKSGAGFSITLGANATFTGNHVSGASGNGGAIWMKSLGNSGSVNLGANAVFTGNYVQAATGNGGAMYLDGFGVPFEWNVWDGAVFTGNYAPTQGGVVVVRNANKGIVRLLALSRDVLFSGNMTGGTFTGNADGSFTVEGGTANAIFVERSIEGQLQLAAAENRQVRFEDPITGDIYRFNLSINQYTDGAGNTVNTTGTVVFSGERYQGDDAHLAASRYNNFVGNTTVYGGTLELRDGVTFGRTDAASSSFTLNGGAVLQASGTGNIINAGSLTLENDSTLRFNMTGITPGDSSPLLTLNSNTLVQNGKICVDLTGNLVSKGSFILVHTPGQALTVSSLTYRGIPVEELDRLQQTLRLNGSGTDTITLSHGDVRSKELSWTMGSGEWDYGSSIWQEGTNLPATHFMDGDKISFSAGNGEAYVITISGNHRQVAQITVGGDGDTAFSGSGVTGHVIEDWDGTGEASSGKLIKEGDGLLDLRATASNWFEGGVELNGGTILINGLHQLQTAEGVRISGTGTLKLYAQEGETVAVSDSLAGFQGTFSMHGGVMDTDTAARAMLATAALHLSDGALLNIRGGDLVLASSLEGNGGRVDFHDCGDTLTMSGLSGDHDFTLRVNLSTGESNRLIIQGEASGAHAVYFELDGDPRACSSEKRITDVILYGSLAENSGFTGSGSHGIYSYSLTGNEAGNGYDLVVSGYSNVAGAVLNTVGAMSMAWFDQLDTINKRMGELRMGMDYYRQEARLDQAAGRPLKGHYWARTTARRSDVDLGISGIGGFTEYQYGGDAGADWILESSRDHLTVLGGFGGYSRSNRRFDDHSGSTGDTDSVYGALYASWLHRSGWFGDMVVKGMSHEATWTAIEPGRKERGRYDNWALGTSMEAGRQWNNSRGWFMEPVAQIAWVHAGSVSAVTDQGLHVSGGAADIWQFAGRLRGGCTWSVNQGRQMMQAYAKVGVIQQVSSGGEVNAGDGSWRPNTDGTRGMAGCGLVWQLSGRNQIHADYEYVYGDKLSSPWTVNLGFTRSF